jgi:hypothetical protein
VSYVDASLVKPKGTSITWETRGQVEVLLAGATAPEPLHATDLVEADLWDQLPADLSLQDEIQLAFHPTLPRVWCRKGRRGQRLVEAPYELLFRLICGAV